jgi:Na+/phosphate symporter
MIIFLSLVICLLGLFMYRACVNVKLQEVGRIMFGVGLLIFLYQDPIILTLFKNR